MIYYITNTAFADVLTSEDEKKYFLILNDKNSDDKIRSNAKNILIERNLRLVAHIAKKYNLKDKDNDDLISIGTIGLIKAIKTYKLDKQVRFVTYASRCIDNEILMHFRARKKYISDLSLNSVVSNNHDGNNEINFENKICNDKINLEDKINFKVEIVKVFDIIKRFLKNREKTIIAMRFGLYNSEEKTQNEIADILGISRSYVSRIEKKALIKINKKLAEYGKLN
ncbi:MAG: sigma-70 family RNA polymerase sigma factor [Clostridiales bacterium]|nr:sigma-70 family RNA polymerase sigma factor [Clostridiales bacterium]